MLYCSAGIYKAEDKHASHDRNKDDDRSRSFANNDDDAANNDCGLKQQEQKKAFLAKGL